LLAFDSFERALLHVCAALERAQRLASLRMRLLGCGEDLPGLAGRLAGAATGDPAARMRRSGPVALGLVQVSSEIGGGLDVELHWRFSRLLDQGLADEEQLIGALAGARQKATLQPDDFAEHASTFDLLKRLISGALATRTGGVNILIHGPPGTGKTEFARTLVAEVGARLFAVGEADEDGEEPTRHERLHALTRAQRLLTRRHDSVLLFDEMEDLFTEASYASTGGRRAGSKIFVNRLLEGNKVPTIWTSNALDGIDPAHLRRLSFVFRMDHPSARARARIAARVAEDEGATDALDGLACLVRQEAEAGSVARAALRAAALAGGTAKDAEAVGKALLVGLRGGRALPPSTGGGTLDLDLYEADHAIGALIERLSEEAAPPDYSLLLTGPPGTGKTALAAHLAERLDRPLTVKRASDLISKWVGGTEANIADAFADAREQGSVLLFDEVDSLLLDRADARHSWEITQVNELLTWMDSHPLPFIAATNFARRLDPAALRRFVFKIELRALSPEAAERAFARFFGREAPRALARIQGLTPGDFAVVARQLHFLPDADTATILGLLEGEAAAKPAGSSRIGF
jgi:SpoVK/Ycf46/Vps4 family AAA+-type ATPase